MCSNPHPETEGVDDDAEEYTMPCAEALLAGTLALMTGYAQHQDVGVRSLMARKVASNLFFLSGHPHLSDAFRTMLGNLRTRWSADGQTESSLVEAGSTVDSMKNWHPAPSHIQ